MKIQGITIHKNKNCNTWYTRYRINGEQHYISAKTQKECYNLLKKELTINKEKNKIYTLINWYKNWLNLFKTNVKNTTIRDYENLLKLVKDKIKNKKITEISTIELQENINNVKAERQKQKLFVFLKALFEKAKNINLIKLNPLIQIEKPTHKKKEGQALTLEEQKRLIQVAKQDKADWLLICLYQGLRKGELLAITGNDLDFKNNKININKSLNEKGNIDTTKNEYSNRLVPMFYETKELLFKYKDYKEERLFNFALTTLHRKFKELIKKANIKNDFRIHDLRHTFITNCKNMNINEHILQGWVGHRIGSEITGKIYTHTNTDAEKKEIQKFYSNSTQKKED